MLCRAHPAGVRLRRRVPPAGRRRAGAPAAAGRGRGRRPPDAPRRRRPPGQRQARGGRDRPRLRDKTDRRTRFRRGRGAAGRLRPPHVARRSRAVRPAAAPPGQRNRKPLGGRRPHGSRDARGGPRGARPADRGEPGPENRPAVRRAAHGSRRIGADGRRFLQPQLLWHDASISVVLGHGQRPDAATRTAAGHLAAVAPPR